MSEISEKSEIKTDADIKIVSAIEYCIGCNMAAKEAAQRIAHAMTFMNVSRGSIMDTLDWESSKDLRNDIIDSLTRWDDFCRGWALRLWEEYPGDRMDLKHLNTLELAVGYITTVKTIVQSMTSLMTGIFIDDGEKDPLAVRKEVIRISDRIEKEIGRYEELTHRLMQDFKGRILLGQEGGP